MKPITLLFSWPLLTLVSILAIGCEKPVPTGKSTTQPPPPETATKPAETTSEHAADDSGAFDPASKGEERPPETKPEPPKEVDTILDIRKTTDKILITGNLRSTYQEKDIVRVLTHNFPDHEVVSELNVGQHVNIAGGWANRVNKVLVPLFSVCDDGHFRFENNTVTIGGTVPDQQAAGELHRMAAYHMDDTDISGGVENNLKVAE